MSQEYRASDYPSDNYLFQQLRYIEYLYKEYNYNFPGWVSQSLPQLSEAETTEKDKEATIVLFISAKMYIVQENPSFSEDQLRESLGWQGLSIEEIDRKWHTEHRSLYESSFREENAEAYSRVATAENELNEENQPKTTKITAKDLAWACLWFKFGIVMPGGFEESTSQGNTPQRSTTEGSTLQGSTRDTSQASELSMNQNEGNPNVDSTFGFLLRSVPWSEEETEELRNVLKVHIVKMSERLDTKIDWREVYELFNSNMEKKISGYVRRGKTAVQSKANYQTQANLSILAELRHGCGLPK